MADPVIRHASSFGGDYVELPRASTAVFKKGWLVSLESSTSVNMDAAGEDATFAGIAYTNHESGDAHNLTSLLKCALDITVTSATYGFGDGLLYSAGSASVEYSLADDSGANTIVNSLQEKTSAVTLLRVLVDVPNLAKLFENNA